LRWRARRDREEKEVPTVSDTQSRGENIALLASSPSKLDRFLSLSVSEELLDFRPDLDEAWTIREQLVHLVDADAALYVRVRRAIAEPGSEAWPIGKNLVDKWHPALGYPSESAVDAVKGLQAIRALTAALLQRIADADWSNFYVIRPDGEKAYLEDLVRVESTHIDRHLEFVERNERLWAEQTS
jgi:hypothetical protein